MTNSSHPIIHLTKKHVKPAAEVIARAFQDYPNSVAMFPDESKRLKKLTIFSQITVLYGLTYGEVYATSPNLEGIIIIFPPNNSYKSFLKMIRCGGIRLPFIVGLTALKRVIHHLLYLDAAHKRITPFPHWYLEFLCIDPKYQGKGFGSLLLKSIIKRIDKEKLPFYCETNKIKNVNFFESNGFTVAEKFYVLENIPKWCLLRTIST